jgi:hypothetical protein
MSISGSSSPSSNHAILLSSSPESISIGDDDLNDSPFPCALLDSFDGDIGEGKGEREDDISMTPSTVRISGEDVRSLCDL